MNIVRDLREGQKVRGSIILVEILDCAGLLHTRETTSAAESGLDWLQESENAAALASIIISLTLKSADFTPACETGLTLHSFGRATLPTVYSAGTWPRTPMAYQSNMKRGRKEDP